MNSNQPLYKKTGFRSGLFCALFVLGFFIAKNGMDRSAQVESFDDITLNLPVLEAADLSPAIWSDITIQKGDTLKSLLQTAGVPSKQYHHLLSLPEIKNLKHLQTGKVLSLQAGNDHLTALRYPVSETEALMIEYQAEKNQFTTRTVSREVDVVPTFKNGVIRDSLFLDGKRAGLSDRLIMEMAELFAWDIDFALDLQPGDKFQVLYEDKYIDGLQSGTGKILGATFSNQGKTYSAIRYTTQDGKTNYYRADGSSLRRAFIRTPVKFSHISSHFNLKRQHPVLHHIRAHKGVDYAAPRGTVVKAVGDGKITFLGRKGGYGNVIELEHQHGKYSTLYAHLNHFSKGLRQGAAVSQGQTIGYVGSTGLATGPHLHYEFRVNGVHHNPMTVTLPQSEPITGHEKQPFLQHANSMLAQMKQREMVMVAAAAH